MIKKILIFTIIILVLIAVALGIQIYLDNNQNPSIARDQTQKPGGIFGFLGFGSDFTTIPDVAELPNQTDQDRPTFIPTLRKITEDPVAGVTFVGTSTLRYVDRGTGHIYEESVNAYDLSKISNTTIPKIYEATWLVSGKSVIYQQLENGVVKSKLIKILDTNIGTSTDSLREISIEFLPDNIKGLKVAPSTNEFAYLQDNSNTQSLVTINGSGPFFVPGRGWVLDWPSTNTLSLTTKASYQSSGYNYDVTRAGGLSKKLGNISGLTTKSNSSWILYSDFVGTLGFNSLNRKTSTTTPLTPATLPEKCVFLAENTALCGSPSNLGGSQYPDVWYQGLVSFDDNIVLYNLEMGESEIIYTPQEPVDIVDPVISSDGQYLMFINKKDLSLWVLNITETGKSTSTF